MRNLFLKLPIEQLKVSGYSTNKELGIATAHSASAILGKAIAEKGYANVILAATDSQMTF